MKTAKVIKFAGVKSEMVRFNFATVDAIRNLVRNRIKKYRKRVPRNAWMPVRGMYDRSTWRIGRRVSTMKFTNIYLPIPYVNRIRIDLKLEFPEYRIEAEEYNIKIYFQGEEQ